MNNCQYQPSLLPVSPVTEIAEMCYTVWLADDRCLRADAFQWLL